MGNKHSSSAHGSNVDPTSAELKKIFEKFHLNDDQKIEMSDFLLMFKNEKLTKLLFDAYKNSNVEHPINFFRPFFDQNVKEIVHFFTKNDKNENASKFVKFCALALNIPLDEEILDSFVKNVVLKSNDDIETCLINTCYQMVAQLNQLVIKCLRNDGFAEPHHCPLQSSTLSPFASWLLLTQMPQLYTKPSSGASSSSELELDNVPFKWSLLFDTSRDGLSMTRFESKVLGYQSPTVSIIELNDHQIFALGVDSPWQMSPQNFGGFNSLLVLVKPEFKILIDQTPNLIFFNTKLRSLDNGILIGSNSKAPTLKIDGDFGNLIHMEVWGCGLDAALADLKNQKAWEMKQAEKHAKVPLPGKWEENPDKAILDMADKRIFLQQ